MAVSAVLDLEVLSSSESGHQFRSGLQRGSTTTASSVSVSPVCVGGEHTDLLFLLSQTVHVFALEKEKSPMGQRIYLVTSYTELWHYYRSISLIYRNKGQFFVVTCTDGGLCTYFFFIRTYTKSLMHCYEVIPEGTVCKLYFDLEFHMQSNKGADGKAMVSSLIQVQCFCNVIVYFPPLNIFSFS